MKTTLGKILSFDPCGQFEGATYGWSRAMQSFGKSDLDIEVTPMDILKHAGIKDAVWCLRAFDYKDYCLFLADVAESVLHMFEECYPDDSSPRKCIQAVRDYHAGKITRKQLETAAVAAYTAVVNTAADAAYTAYAVADAAYTAAAADAAYTAYAVAAYTAYAVAAYTAYAVARKENWQEIEELYIKHFDKGE